MTQYLNNGRLPTSRCPTIKKVLKFLGADVTTEVAVKLAEGSHDVTSLADELGRNAPEVSRTLKQMKQYRMARYTRNKRNRIYSLDDGLEVTLKGRDVHISAETADGGRVSLIMPRTEIWEASPGLPSRS